MVVAIDDGAAQLGADLIELVAEGGHLVGGILVAGDHLIDRVDDDGEVAFLRRPADQARGQLIHGDAAAAQVPDIQIGKMLRPPAQGVVHIPEAVQAGGPVQLQIHIQHPALGTVEAQPGAALGDGDAQLDEGKALARLGGACQQQLMALAQHVPDQRRGKGRQVVPHIRQGLGVRQIIGGGFHPLLPFPGRCRYPADTAYSRPAARPAFGTGGRGCGSAGPASGRFSCRPRKGNPPGGGIPRSCRRRCGRWRAGSFCPNRPAPPPAAPAPG